MRTHGEIRRRGRSRLRLAALGMAALLPLAAGGCSLDDLLEVEDPFTVTPPVAGDTANLSFRFAGARARFLTAVGGRQNTELGIVGHSALMADELYSSDGFGSRWEIDARQIEFDGLSAASEYSFLYLQRARAEALATARQYAASLRDGNAEHAELYNIAGFSVLMLAENFCSGIPLSTLRDDGTPDFGEPLTTAQLYDLAEAYFDTAAAMTGAGAAQVSTARLGKARTLLDKAQFAQAASVAALVPNGYAGYVVEFGSASDETWNALYQLLVDEGRFGTSQSEGTVNQGLPYGDDPRTPFFRTGSGAFAERNSNNGSPAKIRVQSKYAGYSAGIPLATAAEARYIQAEAALQANDPDGFLTHLNAARARAGLGPLTAEQAGTTRDQRVDTLFRERAYSMWLTGHRLSDLRRLIRQYGRTEDQVFPTGVTPNNIPYGDAVSLPVPFDEVNNPNFTGCIDTGA